MVNKFRLAARLKRGLLCFLLSIVSVFSYSQVSPQAIRSTFPEDQVREDKWGGLEDFMTNKWMTYAAFNSPDADSLLSTLNYIDGCKLSRCISAFSPNLARLPQMGNDSVQSLVRAEYYLRIGRPDSALIFYNKYPITDRDKINKGIAFAKINKIEEAETIFISLIGNEIEDIGYLAAFNRCVMNFDRGNLEKANKDLDELVSKNLDNKERFVDLVLLSSITFTGENFPVNDFEQAFQFSKELHYYSATLKLAIVGISRFGANGSKYVSEFDIYKNYARESLELIEYYFSMSRYQRSSNNIDEADNYELLAFRLLRTDVNPMLLIGQSSEMESLYKVLIEKYSEDEIGTVWYVMVLTVLGIGILFIIYRILKIKYNLILLLIVGSVMGFVLPKKDVPVSLAYKLYEGQQVRFLDFYQMNLYEAKKSKGEYVEANRILVNLEPVNEVEQMYFNLERSVIAYASKDYAKAYDLRESYIKLMNSIARERYNGVANRITTSQKVGPEKDINENYVADIMFALVLFIGASVFFLWSVMRFRKARRVSKVTGSQ